MFERGAVRGLLSTHQKCCRYLMFLVFVQSYALHLGMNFAHRINTFWLFAGVHVDQSFQCFVIRRNFAANSHSAVVNHRLENGVIQGWEVFRKGTAVASLELLRCPFLRIRRLAVIATSARVGNVLPLQLLLLLQGYII